MTVRMVRNARLLTLDPEIGDLERGDLLVDGDRIAAVGEHLDAPDGAQVVDAAGCIVVPGFVDTHRHMWQGVLRGIAPAHTLQDYFHDILDRYGPTLRPHDLHVSDLLSARAALGSGVTTVQDVSNVQDSPAVTDAIVSALQESGLRAVFGYGLSRPWMSTHGTRLPDDVRRVRAERLADDDALVTMAVITESGGDDGDERANAATARELDVPVARHAAGRSAAHLRDIGALRPGTTFIHANGAGVDDLAVIADSGGSVSVSPAIEMIMGHGYPLLGPALGSATPTVSLSADVEVTVSGDMFTQMRAAYQAVRNAEHVAGALGGTTVRDVLRMATLDGARSLGLGGRTGSLSPGKQADLVVLRADRPDVAPVHDPYSTVVLQMDRSHVDTVLVAGRTLVENGRSVVDSAALLDDAERIARRVRDTV